MSVPSEAVLRAFDVDGGIEQLAAGYETSVRVGDVVLKRVLDLDVAHFGQEAMSVITLDSATVPTPKRSATGEWSADGWIASEYIDGLSPARNDPALLLHTGREFTAALLQAGPFDESAVRARTDRWARAERFAFNELELPLGRETRWVVDRLRTRTSEDEKQTQLIHADLAGNVFVGPNGTPVVLDFTPACRSVGFQSGVIVADTLLWGDENVEHVALLDGDEASLARGLLFRLIAAELVPDAGNADLARCERVLADLGWN